MKHIFSSLLYILYIAIELSIHMCCNWLNVPRGGRHLTQWWPLFSLADAESAITAHTITTPHSAQQAVGFRFCLTRLSWKKKISRALLKWRNPLIGHLKLSYRKIMRVNVEPRREDMEILVYDWQQCIYSQVMDNVVLFTVTINLVN